MASGGGGGIAGGREWRLRFGARTLTLDAAIRITRPQTVLRGAGRHKTVLQLNKSVTDLFGPTNSTRNGFYVYSGALITAQGQKLTNTRLALVNASVPIPRGTYRLPVNSTARLAVGDMVTLWLQGGNGTLKHEIMIHTADPGKESGMLPATSSPCVHHDPLRPLPLRPLPTRSQNSAFISSRIIAIDGLVRREQAPVAAQMASLSFALGRSAATSCLLRCRALPPTCVAVVP